MACARLEFYVQTVLSLASAHQKSDKKSLKRKEYRVENAKTLAPEKTARVLNMEIQPGQKYQLGQSDQPIILLA